MKTIGIAAHSADGASLCFLTAVREGAEKLGAHRHPTIVLSAIPMGLSLDAWAEGDHAVVAEHLDEGIRLVADAGADFFICPDNTAHIVLETMAPGLPIPGLHIAEVVCDQIVRRGWTRTGLLGTTWTMSGPTYERALDRRGVERLVPDEPTREAINAAIFEELCQGKFTEPTTRLFLDAIEDLESRGAECVILGCTEIPLIINDGNSPLPVLDSTRLLAARAVDVALRDGPFSAEAGWVVAAD